MRSGRIGQLASAFVGFSLTLSVTGTAMSDAGIEVTAPGPKGLLNGTFLGADNPRAPVILIIPGSGPIDRDGNGPGLNTDTYRMIAEGLQSQGIASLRIDKRGLFRSQGATANPDRVSLDAYGDDVRNWISKVREITGNPCVWLFGHSEGGLVAINHASTSPDGVCGLLLAAVPGRPFADVLRDQLVQNPANAPILDQANQAIDVIAAGRRLSVTGLHPALQVLFRDSVQGFWIDLFAFDAPDRLARFNGPVLVLQGTNDIQISIGDADALMVDGGNIEKLLLENANHILKRVTSPDYFANLQTYSDPDIPLHPALVSSIAGFVKANGGSD